MIEAPKSLRYRCQQPTVDLLEGKEYNFIDRGSKILGVAHCDFVGCGIHKQFKQKGNTVWSTTLDDRLGVHIMLDLLPAMGVNVDVLLTDDEEIGASTASLFHTVKDYNWIFSFDRHGSGAVVYDYDCMLGVAQAFFTRVNWGSFSDICYLEHLRVGGINVGTGYFNEHTTRSCANLKLVRKQLARFKTMYRALKDIQIPHYPKPKSYLRTYGQYGFNSYKNSTVTTHGHRTDDLQDDYAYGDREGVFVTRSDEPTSPRDRFNEYWEDKFKRPPVKRLPAYEGPLADDDEECRAMDLPARYDDEYEDMDGEEVIEHWRDVAAEARDEDEDEDDYLYDDDDDDDDDEFEERPQSKFWWFDSRLGKSVHITREEWIERAKRHHREKEKKEEQQRQEEEARDWYLNQEREEIENGRDFVEEDLV